MADPIVQVPLGAQKGPISPFVPVGAPGVAIYSGFIVESEKDPALQGLQKHITYADMLMNHTIVAAGVRFFLNLVCKSKWTFAPADESAEALRLAELTEDIMNDMQTPLHKVVRHAARYKFLGFSALEWTMKQRPDGLYGFDAIESRSQRTIERWDVDQYGRVQGMVQRSPQSMREIYLPRWKVMYLVDDTIHDSPEGMGLFRHIVKAAKRLERYELLEAWGYETDLRGIPIGRGPLTELMRMVKRGELTEQQALDIRKPIEDFVRKHNRSPALGMMLDSAPYRAAGEQQTPIAVPQWDVELLKGEGAPHAAVAEAINRSMHEIARVLGVEHLLLGSNDRGSYALSADKSQAFGMIVESALIEIREALYSDVLTPLWKINGWDLALMPELKMDQVQYRDILQVSGALKDLAAAGAPLMPDDPAIGEMRDLIGLSRPSAASIEAAMQIVQTPPPAPNSGPNADQSSNP